MRVKTPWIEALNKSREAGQSGRSEAPRPKPNLTPKRMSDSFYSAVSDLSLVHCAVKSIVVANVA
jgi:acyl-coenzyme A thioesterase 9